MKVIIRRSPPLFGRHLGNSGVGMIRRMMAILLTLFALTAAYWCVTLLVSSLNDAGPVEAGSFTDRWHVWMGAALVAAATARLSWGVTQRPKNLE